uniref:hypothetical protein n=1 Tax=Acetatifactor sp. TaxID=1872090 RepID=UPI00405721D8
MNMAIAFFVGCLTLVLMMFIKIPLKKLTAKLAETLHEDKEDRELLYKRLNVLIMVVAVLVSLICYYIVLQILGETHFKMCCCLKAGAIAIALYAIFEQWFGDEFKL